MTTTVRPTEQRTSEQNRRMWAALGDIAKQVDWPVDGELQKLVKEDWKIIVTAGLVRHQRIAKGMDGGFVMLGASTAKMPKAQMIELLDLIYAFGAEHGVVWSEPEMVE